MALNFKPKEKLGKFPQGPAKIVTGEKAAKITFVGENAPEFDNGETSAKFDLADLPKTPRLPKNATGMYFVKLSRDKDEVLGIGPLEGMFDARVVDLSRPQEDQDPAPYEIVPKDENWNPYLAFNAYWEILSGTFKGSRISQFFHYKFDSDEDGMTIYDGQPNNPKAKWLPRLVEFCEKTGCVDDPIKWPDDGNILPVLLERILAEGRKVNIVVKNGYIDSLLSGDSYGDFGDDEDVDVDDEFPKSKAKANGNGHKKATSVKSKTPAKPASVKKPVGRTKRSDL